MRVLFVSDHLEYASSTTYTFDLATRLQQRGDEVRISTLGGALLKNFRQSGIEIYRAKFNLFSYWKLLEFLREFDPDIVHVQSLPSLRTGRKIARRLRKPFVVTVHRRPEEATAELEDRLLGGVIALSEVIREALVNYQSLPKSRIRVIGRGVDLERLTPESAEVEDAPGERIPVVGVVGGLRRDKGQETLIRAARLVLDQGLEAHFVLVGEGPDERRLRSLVRQLGLRHHVTFSPHIPDPGDLYRVFDIVALPVLRSGVGVTAIEAMAMRKPVIASAVGEMLQLVLDGVTGLLVPQGSAEDLATAIRALIRDPERRVALGREARRWVEKHHALDPVIDETRAYYEAVLAGLEEEQQLDAASGRRG